MRAILRIGLCLGGLLTSGTALAGRIAVFETGGPGAKAVHSTFVRTLEKELQGHILGHEPRPRSWKGKDLASPAKVWEAARAANADLVIEGLIVKKKKIRTLEVQVIAAGGEVVFSKAAKLPKRKADSAIAALAKKVAKAASDRLSVAEGLMGTSAPVATPVGSRSPADATPTPVKTAAGPLPPAEDEESFAEERGELEEGEEGEGEELGTASSPSSRAKKDYAAAFHLGGGSMMYWDSIETNTPGGNLAIRVAPSVALSLGIEGSFLRDFSASLGLRRHVAKMTHASETNPTVAQVLPAEIETSMLGINFLAGGRMKLDPIYVAAHVGISHNRLNADEQGLANAAGGRDVVVLIPSWSRTELLMGASASYGDLTTPGLTGQAVLLLVPWGSHQESPLTSGESIPFFMGVWGLQSWLRVRYQMPTLLGTWGGVFAGADFDIEYVNIKYEGNGTRTALGTTRPVQASKETRTTLGMTLAVGYVY